MNNRKAFNFYRSYYEVAEELPKKDRLDFLMAILKMQFTGEDTELKGMAKFAFMSQKHSILKQIEGYKSGVNGGRPPKGKQNPPQKGSDNQVQGEEQVQDKVEDKEKEQYTSKEIFEERVKKFLVWFNTKKELYTNKKSNIKVLSSSDEKNLKKLIKSYSTDEFNKAIPNLFKNQWAKENGHLTPSHFLRIENFNKYLGLEEPKDQSKTLPSKVSFKSTGVEE